MTRRTLAALLVAAAAPGLTGCATQEAPGKPERTAALTAPSPNATAAKAKAKRSVKSTRFFAPNSVWNRPLKRRAPLDPTSRQVVGQLRAQVDNAVSRRFGPTINRGAYSTPVYRVSRKQRKVRVVLDNTASYARSLSDVLAKGVPIPRGAKAAPGNDQHMVVWQPSTDTMWEFWKMHKVGRRWHTQSAGRMRHFSRNPGYFAGPAGYPWGATATSLPLVGGMIRPKELARGRIDHALALAIPRPRGGKWSFPAQRTDGFADEPGAVPSGARFRLDPRVDVSKLKVSRTVRIMARAAQRYGIIVRDTAGTVAFYAEDPQTRKRDPYPKLLGSEPVADQLADFPWDKLQLMKLQLNGYRGPGK